MLFRLLDKLRTKPQAQRQQYAFLGAVAITALVSGLWALSIPSKFSELGDRFMGDGNASTTLSQTAGVPFSGIWNRLKSQLQTTPSAEAIPLEQNKIETVIESFRASESTTETPAEVTELPSGSIITIGEAVDERRPAAVIVDTSSSTAQ